MNGMVLILHFCTFHLHALARRHAGVDAEPLMDRPTRSVTLGEFWGARWNRGFHRLAERLVFRPLRRPLGAPAALLAAFVASGVVHDGVISLPARGGYGLPTVYFAIQGLALLAQRRLGLTRGVPARVFTLAATTLPAPLLFHATFVRVVVLPFMAALGALPEGMNP
jgi:alginate O-acetyltransferase complex protein AlgI